jgi:D-alanyl-D-alanine dipeptidase
MAKTYNTLAGDVSAGSVLTASAYNQLLTNARNYRIPPMCILHRTTAQTISNNTETVVQYGTAAVDTGATESPADAMATTGASARITIKTAGVYQVSLQVAWTSVASTFIRASWIKWTSGATIRRIAPAEYKVTDGSVATSMSTAVSLAVNDTLEGLVYHDRGSNLDIALYGGAGNLASVLSAVWIGQVS